MSLWGSLTRVVPTLGVKVREIAAAMTYEITFLVSLAIIFPLTIRGLGTSRYGEYVTLYVIAGLAMIWVYAGVNGAVTQLLLQRNRDTRSVLRVARSQVVLAAAPAGLIGLGLTWWLLGVDLLPAALVVFCADLLVLGLAEANLAALFSHRGVASATRIRIVMPILRALGVLALTALGGMDLMSLVTVNLFASATVLAVSWLAATRMLRERDETREPTSRREMLQLSSLYATTMSANTAQAEGEKFVLAAFRPTSEVGEYQAAYRIVSAALVPFRAVQTAAIRWFLSGDDGNQVHRAWVLSIVSAIYGVACAIGIFVFEPVIRIVLGPEFEAAVTMTQWLAFVPLLHALAEVPLLGLLGLGRNRLRTVLGLATASLAIIAYLCLVPGWGWKGAVVGTYVSELALVTFGWIALIRSQRRSDTRSTVGTVDAV